MNDERIVKAGELRHRRLLRYLYAFAISPLSLLIAKGNGVKTILSIDIDYLLVFAVVLLCIFAPKLSTDMIKVERQIFDLSDPKLGRGKTY